MIEADRLRQTVGQWPSRLTGYTNLLQNVTLTTKRGIAQTSSLDPAKNSFG